MCPGRVLEAVASLRYLPYNISGNSMPCQYSNITSHACQQCIVPKESYCLSKIKRRKCVWLSKTQLCLLELIYPKLCSLFLESFFQHYDIRSVYYFCLIQILMDSNQNPKHYSVSRHLLKLQSVPQYLCSLFISQAYNSGETVGRVY